MIESLQLSYFKAFEEFTVDFGHRNVLVGPNNAGKSTIVQALRLVDIAYRSWARSRRPNFEIFNDKVPFNLRNARNLSLNPLDDATITCHFSGGPTITIEIPEQGALDVSVSTRVKTPQLTIGFLPPVGPLEDEERVLDRNHVRRSMNTHLAPRHFRNLWHHFRDQFDAFGELLEKTWPGVSLASPRVGFTNPYLEIETRNLWMFYKEDRTEREIAWAGTGLQIWMQILTFLIHNRTTDVLVLDEPELYLHADVQRRIGITALQVPTSSQVIVATHSVEILNEMEPEDVLTIDAHSKRSVRLTNVLAVQQTISNLGSAQNIQLSRLARTRRCLFVEGNDIKLLKRLGSKLGFPQLDDSRKFSVFPLEGFANWPLVKGADWTFKNILEENIKAFVLLDRDYRTDSEVDWVRGDLEKKGIRCHVWQRKEIENYTLSEDLITLAVKARLEAKQSQIDPTDLRNIIREVLDQIIDQMKEDTAAHMLAEYQAEQKGTGKDPVTVNLEFRSAFNDSWNKPEWRIARVGGKEAIRRLNRALQERLGVSVSTGQLAVEAAKVGVTGEVADVIREIRLFVEQ